MGTLIDTCVLVDLERRMSAPLDESQAALSKFDDDAFVSAITLGELAFGAELVRSAVKRERGRQFIQTVSDILPSLSADADVARVFGLVASDLGRRGATIGAHDTWIAATALRHNLTVVTANVRHFEYVDGLAIRRWWNVGEEPL